MLNDEACLAMSDYSAWLMRNFTGPAQRVSSFHNSLFLSLSLSSHTSLHHFLVVALLALSLFQAFYPSASARSFLL